MSPTRPDPDPDSAGAQRGFAIVAAVFILVVLAALGGYILSTSATQHRALALDAQASRAHLAARAGVEWGTYQLTRASVFRGDCVAVGATYAGPAPATQTFAAGDLPGLDDFRVDIVCRSEPFDEAGETYRVFQLVATACTAAGGCPAGLVPADGYVEHRMTATVRQ